MQELQVELKTCKEKWLKEIELSKAEKGAPGFPFPVTVTRYTPRPESAAMWDFDELPVRLVINTAEVGDLDVGVEVPDIFPGELPEKIENAIAAEWKKQLSKKSGKASLWMLESTFDWIERQFGTLLRSVPEYVDCYEGCDDYGASMRRYTLVGPVVEEEEEEEEDIDEEEQQRRVEAFVAREAARLEKEMDEEAREAAIKRKQAELGVSEDGVKCKQLSKKELAEQNKSRKERSGQRWRKTGAKAHKPVVDEDAKKKGKK